MKSRLLRHSVIAVALFVLAAGCGDDDAADGDSGSGLGGFLAGSSTTEATTTTEPTTTTSSDDDDDNAGDGPGGLFDDGGVGAPGSGLFDGGHNEGPAPDTPSDPGGGSSDIAAFFGSDLIDPGLGAALHQACAAGDMQACDTMYYDSAPDSDGEAFGATCGGELPTADRFCTELSGAATGSHAPMGQAYSGSAAEGNEAALVNACYRGSMNACDALYDLNLGAESRAYGATCGSRVDTDQYCANLYGLGYEWAIAWRPLVGL